MDVKKNQTAPLSLSGQPSGRSPEMAAFLNELSPENRQAMTRLFRQGAVSAVNGSPLNVLLSNPEAGARVLKAHFDDMAKTAPTQDLADLFKRAADSVMTVLDLRKTAESMRLMEERRKAAELLRMSLDEAELLATLRKLQIEDIQAAMDLLKLNQRELDAMQQDRITVEQLVASGLVVAVTAPVAARSKLEGAADGHAGQRLTLNDAKADERIAAVDPLKAMEAMASRLALDDFN